MEYVNVVKPRLVLLFQLTVLAAMLLAGGPRPGAAAAVLAATGATIAGAALLNNHLDRDIDARMARTRARATARGALPGPRASALGLALVGGGVLLLWLIAGPLAAAFGVAGTLYYVVAYTILLKPRTAFSAVPGALAGVFPALIGWAAAGAPTSLGVFYLCAVIAVWSPPHFWALAYVLRDEYAAAGVPVPALRYGAHRSALQILAWVLALVALVLLPVAAGVFGVVYAVMAVTASLIFAYAAWRLAATLNASWAWVVYRLSGPYLAVIVLAMILDRFLLPPAALIIR